MRGMFRCALAVAIAFSVSGCGKHGAKDTGKGGTRAGTTVSDASADESAALASEEFTAGVTFTLHSDASGTASRIASLKGVDGRNWEGASIARMSYGDCAASGRGADGRIDRFNFDKKILNVWLEHAGLVSEKVYLVSYPNAIHPANYGDSNTFYCDVVTEKFRDLLPEDKRANYHSGVTAVIATRVLDSWTYKNRYEMQEPGKGTVKVFAGTMTYHLAPLVSGMTFQGQGTGSIKLVLDPDSGKWTVVDHDFKDPPLTIQ